MAIARRSIKFRGEDEEGEAKKKKIVKKRGAPFLPHNTTLIPIVNITQP